MRRWHRNGAAGGELAAAYTRAGFGETVYSVWKLVHRGGSHDEAHLR